jgi:hypothetical protein
MMKPRVLSGILLVFAIFILTAACTQPALKDPVVTVGEIAVPHAVWLRWSSAIPGIQSG